MSATTIPPAADALAALSPGALAMLPAEETADADQGDVLPPESHHDLISRWLRTTNIAEELTDEERGHLAHLVSQEYDIDEQSRSDWLTQYEKWLRFAMQVTERKSYPWEGASNIIYPMVTTAALQFHARAYPAVIRDQDVVKGAVVGPDPDGVKATRAAKIGEHMSWQLLDEQEEWEPQTDRLLIILPIVGSMFRKSYFDPRLDRNVSETVTAKNLCVNYKAKSFETAPRHTEIIQLYPYEIEDNIRAGVFLDEDYGSDMDASSTDPDAPITFLEQHRRYDLDGDGYPEPIIVTIARDSRKIARVRAGYDDDTVTWGPDGKVRRIERAKVYTPYGFIPNPMSNVYDIGFGHLLFPINEAVNSSLNQMFDAGHLQNAGGGFIGSGLSMNSGKVRFRVGEYKQVNVTGGTLRDNVLPLDFKGPSLVLFELVKFLVEAGREVSATKDILTGDMPGDDVAATTTLAVIEQGLQVYTAIYKRIYRSLKQEFRLLFRLNAIYLNDEQQYQRGDEWRTITREDYQAGGGVLPVSDARMVTDMQKLGRAQFLMSLRQDPHINAPNVLKRVLEAAQIDKPEDIINPNPSPDPKMMLKAHELDIRQQREQADIAIRAGHDRAMEIRELAQAMLALAQAKKFDAEADLGWIDRQIANLRLQLDTINALSDTGTGAASQPGGGGPAAGAGGGDQGPGLPALAPPSGQQAVPGLP